MKKLFTLCLCALLLTFVACKDNGGSPEPEPVKKRTVIAYIFMDVNMWEYLLVSINQMEAGYDSLLNGKLLVFVDKSPNVTQFDSPVLLEIQHDTTDKIVSRVVKKYPDRDAANPAVVREVLQDAATLYPADSYGLLMAGHGDGSIFQPEGNYKAPQQRSVGFSERYGYLPLNIDKLAAALPVHFEFILFHACNMSDAAALYQLRKKADYVVASVEVLAGPAYPYDVATKHLFAQPKADLAAFVKDNKAFYEAADKQMFYYSTLAVYDLSQMEALAAEVKKTLAKLNLSYDELRQRLIASAQKDYGKMMVYPAMFKITPETTLDLRLLVNEVAKTDKALAESLAAALSKIVNNQMAVVGDFDVHSNYATQASHISLFIPNAGCPDQNEKFFTRLEWAEASGMTRR